MLQQLPAVAFAPWIPSNKVAPLEFHTSQLVYPKPRSRALKVLSADVEDVVNLHHPGYKWRLTIAYDGTRFSGWQYQKSIPTVQCIVEQALTRVTKLEREDLQLVGAGRTDAGVHAYGQVAHFVTPFKYDSLEGFHKAINGLLSPDIRIREISPVVPEFHARFSVTSKIYVYKIYNDAVMDPFHRHYAFHSAHKLNATAMSAAAKYFVGNHDYSAFSNVSCNDRLPNPVKNIMRFDVNEMVIRGFKALNLCNRDLSCSLKLKDLVFYIDKFETWLHYCFKLEEKHSHLKLCPRFWHLGTARN